MLIYILYQISSVYLVWLDNRKNEKSIYFNYSRTEDQSWQDSGIKLNTDITEAYSYSPLISSSNNSINGNIYVLWTNENSDNTYNHLYFNGLCCVPVISEFYLSDKNNDNEKYMYKYTNEPEVNINITAFDADYIGDGDGITKLLLKDNNSKPDKSDFINKKYQYIFPPNSENNSYEITAWVMDTQSNISTPLNTTIILDRSAPKIESYNSIDEFTVDIIFNEDVLFADNLYNYSPDNDLLINSVENKEKNTYRLITSQQKSGGVYTIAVKNNIIDIAGNNIDSTFNTITFTTKVYDSIPPVVINAEPSNNVENITISTNITIEFSEPINQESFDIHLKDPDEKSFTGSKTWDGNKVVFDPEADLDFNTKYSIHVNSVQDLAGNSLTYQSTFGTMDFPTSPAAGVSQGNSDSDDGGGLCFIITAED